MKRTVTQSINHIYFFLFNQNIVYINTSIPNTSYMSIDILRIKLVNNPSYNSQKCKVEDATYKCM